MISLSHLLELRSRWPFRIVAGLVGIAIGLTFGGLIYDVVRNPHDLDFSLAEWVEVVVSFLVLGAIGFVSSRIAFGGSLFEPPVPLVDPNPPCSASNCIRCGSFCAPETGAFIAPTAAALCTRCIRQLHRAVAAGPDAVAIPIGCSFCGRRDRSELLTWPGGTICRSCLELAATQSPA